MKTFHFLVLVIFGFFLMPAVTFACGSRSQNDSCNKETSATSGKMDCCENNPHSKNTTHECCNGKCGHSRCVTAPIRYSVAFFEIKFKMDNFELLEKKQSYFNTKTNLSSGFSSLWLIPKIS